MKHFSPVALIPLMICLVFADTCMADCWELTDSGGQKILVDDIWHIRSRISGQAAVMGLVSDEPTTVPVEEIDGIHLEKKNRTAMLPFMDSHTMQGKIVFRDGTSQSFQSGQELYYSGNDGNGSIPLSLVRSVIRCAEGTAAHSADTTDEHQAGPVTQSGDVTADSLLLDNGDRLYGSITTDEFNWKAPYATLTFRREQILSLSLPTESGAGLLELRSGDRISGTLLNPHIEVELSYGQRVPLATEFLKSIRFASASP